MVCATSPASSTPTARLTIYGVTSTVSGFGEQGADPNEIVGITELLAATTLPANEMFAALDGPQYGVVYRGIAIDPVPEPGTIVVLGSTLAGRAAVRRRKVRVRPQSAGETG